MDDYIVSARKYRPDSFESVVGQDSITKTLKNSIKTNKFAQAYLFCGPRGVGKTTCARIFAKTINCNNISNDFEACNECESCSSFNNLRSFNIHELDAASNNSVDDIRHLIDQVRIPPQIGNYSVYIIDEVHMLSSSAFNAFLKTLEEPPKHVIFILATTEKHKIIPTILSRCQIFDFNRIGVEDIRQRLEFVAKKENVDAEQDALHIIAQKSDGAMRDALSIFDQIVSFSGRNITYENTIKNLNVLDYEVYFKITDSFLTGNYSQALLIFDEVIRKGFEANFFISGLASHFRDILMCKEANTIELIEVGEKIKQKYIEHAQKCSVAFLFKAIGIANQADLNYKMSHNKRLLVELALLNICNIENKSISTNTTVENKVAMATPKTVENQKIAEQKVPAPETIIKEEPKTTEPLAQEKPKQVAPQQVETKKEEPQKEESYKKPASYSGSGISIKELTKDITDEKEEVEVKEPKDVYSHLEEQEYSEEKLMYVWSKYAETQKHNERIYTCLISNKPKQKDKDVYQVFVDNNNIKKVLDNLMGDTLKFMKTELNNRNFNIEYTVNEAPRQERILKTDQDKFNDMVEENPELKNLANQLNLDFE